MGAGFNKGGAGLVVKGRWGGGGSGKQEVGSGGFRWGLKHGGLRIEDFRLGNK